MADQPGTRDHTAEALRLAEAVRAFIGDPRSVLHVVAKGSPQWQQYADWAEEQYRATDSDGEVRAKGLVPGAAPKERDPVWRARRAAWDAFRGPAEHAVIAAHGDSRLFTVAAFTRTEDDLRIVGAGSTHPGIGGAEVSGVPTSGQMGDAVWYSLSRLAAKEAYALVDALPSSTWRGPRSRLEQPVIIGVAGDWRHVARESRLTAAEVEQLSATATNRLPGMRNPFTAVEDPQSDQLEVREYAVRLGRLLDRGLRIHVVESGGLGSEDAVPVAGARSVVVEQNGKLLATAGLVRQADGAVRIREVEGREENADAVRAVWAVACREAARFGVKVVGDERLHSSASEVVAIAAVTDKMLGSRADDVPGLGWYDAGTPGAASDTVAAAAARFVDAGGDVLRLTPDDPQYEVMKERVAAMMAEALSADLEESVPRTLNGAVAADPAVDEGLAGMWQAFNPSVGVRVELGPQQTKFPLRPGTAVAVAIGPDGIPQAAVGYRETNQRIELGAAGSRVGGDSIAAAVVEGAYRTANGRPVGGYLADPIAETYGQAGARLGGPEAVNAAWLTGVELSGPAASQIVAEADRQRAGNSPDDLDFIAAHLRDFSASTAGLTVLNHSTEAGRRRAEYVRSAADPESSRFGPVPVHADPHQVTIAVVDRGQPMACATVDSRPGQPISVVGAVQADNWPHRAAMYWWIANHQVRLDRPIEDSTSLDRTKALVAGVHHRLQGQVDNITKGAGAEYQTVAPPQIRHQAQPEATRRLDQRRGHEY